MDSPCVPSQRLQKLDREIGSSLCEGFGVVFAKSGPGFQIRPAIKFLISIMELQNCWLVEDVFLTLSPFYDVHFLGLLIRYFRMCQDGPRIWLRWKKSQGVFSQKTRDISFSTHFVVLSKWICLYSSNIKKTACVQSTHFQHTQGCRMRWLIWWGWCVSVKRRCVLDSWTAGCASTESAGESGGPEDLRDFLPNLETAMFVIF